MATRREDAEARKVSAMVALIEKAERDSALITKRWVESYDMFVYGSRFKDKQDWQVQLSINKFASSIRAVQGEMMATLINTPNWWSLDPKSPNNGKASMLKPAFEKMMNYYLDASNFKRHAGTFFLNSLISIGNLFVGWKQMLVQNPAYVLEQTRAERQRDQARLAKNVENPQVTEDSESELASKIEAAAEDFKALATGEEVIGKPKPKKYVQMGVLDFKDPNHENIFWDTNVAYMEDSLWKAFEYEANLYELKHMAKLGFFSKSAVDNIPSKKPDDALANQGIRYQNLRSTDSAQNDSKVLITVYMGPLIVDNEVVKDKVFCVIANRAKILKESEYPFWEPPGHHTALINAAVKQVPGRATGAGIGDSAIELQKVYDSNWQLICDTFRFGIAGINIVDYQQLVDKSSLDEGIEPGKTIQVRGDPKKVFHREQLTHNLENQVTPVQEMLRQGIEELIGVNAMFSGAPNLRSRTTAAETQAQLSGSQRTTNTIALDLEQNFIVPTLQKVFARVLQFGLLEIETNPELDSLLDEDEKIELKRLNDADRLSILQSYYRFKIKGFSAQQDRAEKLARMNEVLSIINSGGPLSMLIDLPKFMELWAELMELKDDNILIVKDSPLAQIEAENTTLMGGHMVSPGESDDHELHIKLQGPLAAAPYATPEMQQHVQEHTMMLQMIQQMQAEQEALMQADQATPPQAPPATRVRFEPDENGNRSILIDEVS